jgi:ribonuclease BN (tRNA processing enzyme)
MKLKLGGVRGTSPVADPAFAGFGGDTTSLLVEPASGEGAVVIDAGSGVRELDPLLRNGSQRDLLLLMTHYHLDHVTGFPWLSLIYNPEWSIRIVGPRLQGHTAEEVIHSILARPLWPLQVDALQASISFDAWPEEPGEPLAYAGLEIRWCPQHHAGSGSVAYRIDEPATGSSLVMATDIEWQEASDIEKAQFVELCRTPRPADVMLFDGHFLPDEYEQFRGWGHSTWQDAVEAGDAAGVGNILIIHHAPGHDDKQLNELEAEIQKEYPNATLARQGAHVDVLALRKA